LPNPREEISTYRSPFNDDFNDMSVVLTHKVIVGDTIQNPNERGLPHREDRFQSDPIESDPTRFASALWMSCR
jgi:hypothetical protein